PALALAELEPDGLEALWRNLQGGPATAKEVDTHWRLLHGVLITRARLHRFGHAPEPDCIFCGEVDSVSHAYFACEYSRSYVEEVRQALCSSLSPAFSPATFSSTQLLLGLPALAALVDKAVKPTLRAVVAITIQTLHDTRHSRIRSLHPTTTSLAPSSLAMVALQRLSN
ncbi:hypothetical protein JCM1840_004668, partial [Sporobolomyces johnsonii]